MKTLLALVGLLALPMAALAWTGTPTGVLPSFTYTEPSTNTDGSPLTDLAKMRIYWKLGTGAETMVEFPASGPSGGQTRTKNDLAVPVLPCGIATMTSAITAVDTSNNESARAAFNSLPIDRKVAVDQCPPSEASNLNVQ